MIVIEVVMRKNSGFTLIELIIVILILGVLGAYAAPKFMGLDGKAKERVMLSLQSSVRTADEMVHSLAVIDGVDGLEKAEIKTPEQVVINVSYGYAVAKEKDGIDKAVDFDSKQIKFSCKDNVCKWEANIPDASKCFVSYKYDGNGTPEIGGDFSDCIGRKGNYKDTSKDDETGQS